jgi:N-acetylmuramoyl-L-alanine amidase
MPYKSIVISSGHAKHVQGAVGILNEVDEARRVTEQVATELRNRGVEVKTFHDDTSHDQSTNLSTIVAFHNKQKRELDVSVHFNAYIETDKGMGTECLYVSQQQLASQIASGIASASGLINRGAKKRTDLYFLNNTAEPAVLLEVCFVDSTLDANTYNMAFDRICDSIADVLGGKEEGAPAPEPPTEVAPPEAVAATVDIQIAITGNVQVTVNGEPVDVAGHGRAPTS